MEPEGSLGRGEQETVHFGCSPLHLDRVSRERAGGYRAGDQGTRAKAAAPEIAALLLPARGRSRPEAPPHRERLPGREGATAVLSRAR